MCRLLPRRSLYMLTGLLVLGAEELLDRDHFKSADEAKDFGLLDEVIAQRPAPPTES